MSIGKLNIENIGQIDIEPGLNLITVADSMLYSRLIAAIDSSENNRIIYSENNHPKLLEKVSIFLGDPVSGGNIQSAYSKFVGSILSKNMSEEGMDKLFQLNMQIRSVLENEIINHNLPLNISSNWEIEKLIKTQNISVEKTNSETVFGKIESVIHVMGMLAESKYLLLTNLSLYCNMSELNQLHQCLLAEGINLISLNLSWENAIFDETFHSTFIDQDFVRF